MRLIYPLLLCVVLSAAAEDPPGHLQRLGSHAPPIEVEVRETMPDPVEFFETYVKTATPVILKGAAKLLPNYDLWKSDTHLSEVCGLWMINVEEGKYEGSVFGRSRLMTFNGFLQKYKEKQYYLIHDIQNGNALLDEMSFPKPLICGGYKEHLARILLLFSSGSTNSALHVDSYNNMHCLLDGTKDWVLYHRDHSDLIPAMDKFAAYGAMDARSVDMYKFPIIQYLPWYHAFIEAGDCFYLPQGWYHHVKSSDSRNMALVFWINHMHELTEIRDCPKNFSDLEDYRIIHEFDTSRFYRIRSALWLLFEDGPFVMPESLFIERCGFLCEEDCTSRCTTLFKRLDINEDALLIADEVTKMAPELAEDSMFDDIIARDNEQDEKEEKKDPGKAKQEL